MASGAIKISIDSNHEKKNILRRERWIGNVSRKSAETEA